MTLTMKASSTYTMTAADKSIKVENLTVVDQHALSLQEAIKQLINGQVLVIANYETTTNSDVFVKLDLTLDNPLTEISMSSPDSFSGASWSSYPLPMNALALYDVYTYDKNLYDTAYFNVGDIVKYKADKVVKAGVVDAIYTTTGGTVYYSIGGTLYTVTEQGARNNDIDANISGEVTSKLSVADMDADSHTAAVSDYESTVYVLL